LRHADAARAFELGLWYELFMSNTKTLEALVERASALPEEAQRELVEAMTEAMNELETRHAGVYRLSEDERQGIERGLAAMREGRFAGEEKVAAIFRKARSRRV
jgi:predicted transcriptional regulator